MVVKVFFLDFLEVLDFLDFLEVLEMLDFLEILEGYCSFCFLSALSHCPGVMPSWPLKVREKLLLLA